MNENIIQILCRHVSVKMDSVTSTRGFVLQKGARKTGKVSGVTDVSNNELC